MDISTITHVTSDYIKNALEESATASKTENRDFGRVFPSAPVSYTHLDVYKRQTFFCLSFGFENL